jgi:hypothetical protein
MEAICSSETLVGFNGLQGVISQKIVLFITTAVRTSNLTLAVKFVISRRLYIGKEEGISEHQIWPF